MDPIIINPLGKKEGTQGTRTNKLKNLECCPLWSSACYGRYHLIVPTQPRAERGKAGVPKYLQSPEVLVGGDLGLCLFRRRPTIRLFLCFLATQLTKTHHNTGRDVPRTRTRRQYGADGLSGEFL